MTSHQPALSVVLATDRYETIRSVVRCLCRQTARAQLELIILAPTREALGLDPSELTALGQVRVLEVGPMIGFARARAVGIRAASAPVVVIGETHSFPHPGWAEALIQAHKQPWAVVIPGFGNANADGPLSWAAFLRDYGCWLAGLPAGEIFMMPTHNASYKRQVLLELGDKLEEFLSHGDQLNLYLRAHGHRVYFEPAAKIDHLNVSRLKAWVDERYLCGLLIAAQRARRWSWRKRLLYVFGSPLIPGVVVSRTRDGLRQARRQGGLPSGTTPALVLGAIVSTVGEVVGYTRGGSKTALQQMIEYEMHKARYVAGAEQHVA